MGDTNSTQKLTQVREQHLTKSRETEKIACISHAPTKSMQSNYKREYMTQLIKYFTWNHRELDIWP